MNKNLLTKLVYSNFDPSQAECDKFGGLVLKIFVVHSSIEFLIISLPIEKDQLISKRLFHILITAKI